MEKTTFLILFLLCIFLSIQTDVFSQNNITITDDETYTANESAVLDIYSLTKGMLVPRMTSDQRNAVLNPSTGLLVFDTDYISFFFYNGTNWEDLSGTGDMFWSENVADGNIYLSNIEKSVGIGTDDPVSKLEVVANSGADPAAPLFEIQDEFGIPIFTVTSEGVRVFVKDIDAKAVSGGFAVGRYKQAKELPDTTLFLVTSDSTRVFTSSPEKGVAGGFAIGVYGQAKNNGDYMHITQDNYLIGHNAGASLTNGINNVFVGYEAGLTTSGGVGNQGSYNLFIGFNSGKENSTGFENVFLGYQSGISNKTGQQNIFIGNDAGFENINGFQNIFIGQSSGFNNIDGTDNVFIGENAGFSNQSGTTNIAIGNNAGYSNNNVQNIFIGPQSGRQNSSGIQNIMIGLQSGYYNTGGDGNIFIGVASGEHNTGSHNVFIGHLAGYNASGSNRLYIENSNANSENALIYGEFDNKILSFNVNTSTVEGKVNIDNVLRLEPRSSEPQDPEEGDMYFDGEMHILRIFDGTQWINLW